VKWYEHVYIALAVDPVTYLGRLLGWIVVLAVAVYLISCSAPAWPAACPLEDGVRRCRGGVWRETLTAHPMKPRPSCRVTYSLDGVALPVTVDADDCGP
jgi:hypothetical protein